MVLSMSVGLGHLNFALTTSMQLEYTALSLCKLEASAEGGFGALLGMASMILVMTFCEGKY
jgi:hypothetical protein